MVYCLMAPSHYLHPCADLSWFSLTHWGRVTYICTVKLTVTGSDNGLLPGRRQAIIRTNAGILLIEPLGTNFSENLIEILTFSFTKMRLKVSSAKWRPFCLSLSVLIKGALVCCIPWPGAVISQWSILAVRHLCENNPENQAVIAGLKLEGISNPGLLSELGITAKVEGEKVTVKQAGTKNKAR